MDAARAEVAHVLQLDPRYSIKAAARFYISADIGRKQAFLTRLRAAGLPE
jgi:hypothetical protein